MSKYIVDIDDFEPLFKVDSIGVFGIGKSVSDDDNDHSWSRIKSIEDFEELNSDYINEHYGQLQDDAYERGHGVGYQKGYKECKARYCSFEQAEYQRGLDDAWDAAKKIALGLDDGGFSTHYLKKVFGSPSFQYAFKNNSASEAIEKLKAYEEQKADDEIDEKITSFLDCNGYAIDEVFNRLKRMKGEE